VRNLYDTRKDWNQFCRIRLIRKYAGSRVEAELFAQLWSAYTDPALKKALFDAAPQASIFMNEVIKHAQTRKLRSPWRASSH
jgi:siroheme synthase (precorrin-2 oxidase/ferrochelatase)